MGKEIELITTYLDKLAGKLGVGAGQIWPWLIKQQYVDGFLAIFLFICSTIGLYACVRFVIKHWNPDSVEANPIYSICREDHEPVWVILSVILIIVWFITLGSAVTDIRHLLNPEYGALKDLLYMLRYIK